MSIHKVNIDAIAAGAGAFLCDWPNEPRPATSVPARAHQVLWEDDYWRGVDMAREAVDELVAGWKRVRTEEIGNPGEARVSARLDVAVRATMMVVVSRMTHGQVLESDDADLDLADVIEEALRGIVETGDPEHRTEAPRSCDDEVAADAWAEA